MRFMKAEKIIFSFLIAAVLALNIVSPVAAALTSSNYNSEGLPTCNLFCNLQDMAKDKPCPHHEKTKKRLSELFDCKIIPASCHDTPAEQAASQADPYLLSNYIFDDNLNSIYLNSAKLNIPFQIYDFFLEKPPTILS